MEEVLTLILEHGVYPVLMATLIIIVLVMFKRFGDLTKRLPESKQPRSPEQKQEIKENEKKGSETNTFINIQINTLRELSHANRVLVFLYHNGYYTVNGKSFQKMSVTHESIDMVTAPVMQFSQNLPRQSYPLIQEKLFQAKHYENNDIETIKAEDPVSYYMFNQRGTKAIYLRGIYDQVDGFCLGFLCIEYGHEDIENFDEIKIQAAVAAERIGAALAVAGDETKKKGEDRK